MSASSSTKDFDSFSPIPLDIRAYVNRTQGMLHLRQQRSVNEFKADLLEFLEAEPHQIETFGSFHCGTQIGETDIDLSVEVPYDSILTDADQSTFEQAISDSATRKRIFDEFILRVVQAYLAKTCRLKTIFCAGRVKILKVKLPLQDYDVCLDVSINNQVAVHNSKLIAEYIRIFPPLKSLSILVKFWAKTYQISGSAKGFLSSYAFVILIIYYLQQYKIVPNLQEATHRSEVVDGYECKFLRGSAVVHCPLSFEKLLKGFYEFVNWTNLSHVVACISSSRVKTIHMQRKGKWDNRLMLIEDPFITTRNLGDVMHKQPNKDKLKREFARALTVLETGDLGSIEEYFTVSLAEVSLL
jgi:DNA polymerase sigma